MHFPTIHLSTLILPLLSLPLLDLAAASLIPAATYTNDTPNTAPSDGQAQYFNVPGPGQAATIFTAPACKRGTAAMSLFSAEKEGAGDEAPKVVWGGIRNCKSKCVDLPEGVRGMSMGLQLVGPYNAVTRPEKAWGRVWEFSGCRGRGREIRIPKGRSRGCTDVEGGEGWVNGDGGVGFGSFMVWEGCRFLWDEEKMEVEMQVGRELDELNQWRKEIGDDRRVEMQEERRKSLKMGRERLEEQERVEKERKRIEKEEKRMRKGDGGGEGRKKKKEQKRVEKEEKKMRKEEKKMRKEEERMRKDMDREWRAEQKKERKQAEERERELEGLRREEWTKQKTLERERERMEQEERERIAQEQEKMAQEQRQEQERIAQEQRVQQQRERERYSIEQELKVLERERKRLEAARQEDEKARDEKTVNEKTEDEKTTDEKTGDKKDGDKGGAHDEKKGDKPQERVAKRSRSWTDTVVGGRGKWVDVNGLVRGWDSADADEDGDRERKRVGGKGMPKWKWIGVDGVVGDLGWRGRRLQW